MNVDFVETRPCALCGEYDPSCFKIFFDGRLKLYRCLKCGFVAQFPGPGKSQVVTSYEDFYTLEFTKKNEFMYPQRRLALQDMVDRVAHIKPSGRLLDVGCGDGHFLHLCAKKGYECYGVEDSKDLAQYAASKSGGQIIQGMYNKDMFPEAHFDVISFIQVVEHIPQPVSALEAAYHHLSPGGVLLVEIPSIQAPHFIAYRLTRIKWFVKPPDGVIPCHFGYYSPKTMEVLATKCGFEKLSLVTGRWKYKYSGALKLAGIALDSVFNATGIGGILYLGEKKQAL